MATNYPKTRDGMWQAIRVMKRFVITDIAKCTGHHKRSVKQYLDVLEGAGHVASALQEGADQPYRLYRLINDVGHKRPLLSNQGKTLAPSARQRIWVALKVVGKTPLDWRHVSFVAGCEEEVAKEYINILHRAGYLHLCKAIQKGKKGAPAQYRFLSSKDTGPKAPEYRKRAGEVYDPNLQKTVWKKEKNND